MNDGYSELFKEADVEEFLGRESTLYLWSTRFFYNSAKTDFETRSRTGSKIEIISHDDISDLEFEQLLTEKETPVLKQANIGTRAFVVIGWLEAIFNSIKKQLKDIDASPWEWHKQLQNAKGGIGATLGMLGCPLPYIYTHLVYWIVQLVLISLAIETGTWMAIGVARRENGDGEYVFSDDAHEFPDNPRVWYANMFMVKVFSNVCFALFTEGLLQICDKIQNPFSEDDEHAFPIKLYDIFFNNNCRALVFGFDSRAFIDDHSFV